MGIYAGVGARVRSPLTCRNVVVLQEDYDSSAQLSLFTATMKDLPLDKEDPTPLDYVNRCLKSSCL